MSKGSLYKSPAGKNALMAIYDSVLASWPVPKNTLNVPTRHGKTFVVVCGEESAPPLVLLHGSASNSSMWAGDVADYCRDYRVYAVDLIGEAGKSAPSRPEWNGPAFAEWLDDVLDALKLEKATLIGCSQGGWTALKFAVARPERVGKLVLLSPGGIIPARMSFLLRVIPLTLLGGWGAERIKSIVLGDQQVTKEADEFTTLSMRHFKPRIGAQPIFSDEDLRRLIMPTLLLGGAKDSIFDMEEIARRMAKLLPCFTAAIFPEAGHVLMNTPTRIMPFLADPG